MASAALTFFAVVSDDQAADSVYRLVIDPALQKELSEYFLEEAGERFLSGRLERVPFQSGWQDAEDGEVIQIGGFPMPANYVDACSSAIDTPPLTLPLKGGWRIRGLLAYTSRPRKLYIFQPFNKRRLISLQRTGLFLRDRFERIEGFALSFDGPVGAVHDGGDLFFLSFRKAASLLDLSAYFQDATNPEIQEVLAHDLMSAEDESTTLQTADKWMRRRFSMLRSSGLLDATSVQAIAKAAKAFNLPIRTTTKRGKHQLVFPAEFREAKELLRFLNEEMYEGPITSKQYVTNAKRLKDQGAASTSVGK